MPIDETWHVVCRDCEFEDLHEGRTAKAKASRAASHHQRRTGHKIEYGQIEEGTA